MNAEAQIETNPVSLPRFCAYFLWLGSTGFGGPIALAGYMQRDLVERRRWVTKEDYLEGLALAQLAPGPLAAQLAIYLGYLRAGTFGASLVGLAFIGPSFLMYSRSLLPTSGSADCHGCSLLSTESAPLSSRSSQDPHGSWRRWCWARTA